MANAAFPAIPPVLPPVPSNAYGLCLPLNGFTIGCNGGAGGNEPAQVLYTNVDGLSPGQVASCVLLLTTYCANPPSP